MELDLNARLKKRTSSFAKPSDQMCGKSVFGGRLRCMDRARKVSKALLLRYPFLHLYNGDGMHRQGGRWPLLRKLSLCSEDFRISCTLVQQPLEAASISMSTSATS